MLDRIFGGDTFEATTRALDAAALRHQTIANNLANVNTPGYKRQDVQFEAQLARALEQRRGPCGATCDPLSTVQPTVITQNDTSERSDGNNVDIETENVHLAVNTLHFETLT